MTINVNCIGDAARGGLVTVASPGFGQAAAVDFGTAGNPIYYLLATTTGDAVATATQQGYVFESTFGGGADELSTANGYTVRGMTPGNVLPTVASHVLKVTTSAATWTATSGGLSPYGCYLVSHESTAAASPFLLYYSFSGVVTATSATLTVTPNASGLFTIT